MAERGVMLPRGLSVSRRYARNPSHCGSLSTSDALSLALRFVGQSSTDCGLPASHGRRVRQRLQRNLDRMIRWSLRKNGRVAQASGQCQSSAYLRASVSCQSAFHQERLPIARGLRRCRTAIAGPWGHHRDSPSDARYWNRPESRKAWLTDRLSFRQFEPGHIGRDAQQIFHAAFTRPAAIAATRSVSALEQGAHLGLNGSAIGGGFLSHCLFQGVVKFTDRDSTHGHTPYDCNAINVINDSEKFNAQKN